MNKILAQYLYNHRLERLGEKDCDFCDGHGEYEKGCDVSNPWETVTVRCDKCDGTGRIFMSQDEAEELYYEEE
jgi:DnaJ-class molecular chaperone